ncbi:SHOCT domain-containing protein [Dyadobacter aurulentus]|uniref:SHOCT domain-containing protein n=1 Tax=Dyadobacter sp. UC 10 TaxID=2605428 RepID=UPI0011F2BFEE|nr:SHOCT domain-containing protein [Dyadobacter sp. UC 10]KAA0991208.1 SHOCT domain-containing protein [Dyadobacter sp. UC 10]
MKALTKEGQQHVSEIAERYSLKTESVETLLKAVINGGGKMAQFNIAELGGQGQWMRGGMTMVGDMFNSSVRTTVDKICNELSDLVTSKVLFEESADLSNGEHASHESYQKQGTGTWPAVFGNPTSSGSQNSFHYAYFSPVHRLVIDEDGKRTIYDTKHHQITGVSQQQGPGNSYRFTSQDGYVDLHNLPVISEPRDGSPRDGSPGDASPGDASPGDGSVKEQSQPTPGIVYDVTATADLRTESTGNSPQDIIIATIEKINVLYERGQITEEEFKSKKQELLTRL